MKFSFKKKQTVLLKGFTLNWFIFYSEVRVIYLWKIKQLEVYNVSVKTLFLFNTYTIRLSSS